MCAGAMGLSHHINPAGDIEFCPPVQFARDNAGDGKNLAQIIEKSEFLKTMRNEVSNTTRGCILLENPQKLKSIVESQNAYDSSKRDKAYSELSTMQICPGHNMPANEIPEKSRLYRFAKKHWFFGFGAYG